MPPKPPLSAPARWSPPRSPGLTGPYARNEALAELETWWVPGTGPEDVALDAGGRVYTGTAEGQLLRLSAAGRRVDHVATTGGRPLGIEVDADGTLVVCDAYRGLLRVDPESGRVAVLADGIGGVPFVFTNNCDLAADGAVYFTDSSRTHDVAHFKGDLLEHGSSGRLLRWTADEGVEVVLDGLDFANGVALAPDDSFVLVAETGGYRIRKVWLTGPRAGAAEVLVDNLPAMPDNMSTGEDGVFWVALPAERNALLDLLLPRPGLLRRAVWALPERLQPDASRIVFVLGIDADGRVRHNLQARSDRYHFVTGVREHDGWLYLGSLVESGVARVRLPSLWS